MNNKKIGVLTFHNTVNYGAMLQTYALQKYINDLGSTCEVIDYKNETLEKVERPMKLLAQRTPKGVLKYLKCHRYQLNKWNRFEAFKAKNIRMSDKVYTMKNISQAETVYDAFIVGSDQVWNVELTGNDYAFYLDFVKDDAKKYSYAASFGFSDWPEGERDRALGYLKSFKKLNVRERQAKELIYNGLGIDRANVVIDPTLLLSKSEWSVFAKDDVFNDHIVVYMIDFCKEVFDFIRNLSDKTGCRVIYVHDAIRSQKDMINSRDDSVENFISMIKNARYIVTGSFHALCMSLVFEKQFFYTLNSKNNRNSRLENLMDTAGLVSRRIIDGKCDTSSVIDYTDVSSKLTPVIEKSKKTLNEILKEIFIDEQN